MDTGAKLTLLALVAGGFLMFSNKTARLADQPRGIRNHNPGNIRHGDNWQGMADNQRDPSFITFIQPEYGIRAMARILKSYKRRGVDTVAEIIATWAPPIENDTHAYINHVAHKLNVHPDTPIEQGRYPELIAAIIHHENGVQPYSYSVISAGVAMA
ncbi:structural protein [Endozoicomonas sp.]|uniref:structural protein n=1 Tax=Endozoicomonas sp. TaxID=1892382 RepID=UPI003AF934AF